MRDEPSTYRMRADEVRALIRRLEPQPPPHASVAPYDDVAPTREREPPTLLYKRSRRRDEPETLRGLGTFTPHETTSAPSPAMDVAPDCTHECAVELPPDERRAPLRARVPASERVRTARRRSIAVGCVIVALLAIAPLLMALVRRTTGSDAPAAESELVRGGLPVEASARARVVTHATLPATQGGVDPVRRATELLMDGDSAGALSAFRTLSRAHPEHFALGHVVRSLEQRLRACAEDVAACR